MSNKGKDCTELENTSVKNTMEDSTETNENVAIGADAVVLPDAPPNVAARDSSNPITTLEAVADWPKGNSGFWQKVLTEPSDKVIKYEATSALGSIVTTQGSLQLGYEKIVQHLKDNCTFSDSDVANVADSAPRAAAALEEMCLTREKIISEVKSILSKTFPVDTTASDKTVPVVQSNISAVSLCPHHLLPIISNVSIGYQPRIGNGKVSYVIGLSKLARIVQLLARRPVIQEQYNKDIVDVFLNHKIGSYKLDKIDFKPECMGVIVTAMHCCMLCRGVQTAGLTTTEVFRVSTSLPTEQRHLETIRDMMWKFHKTTVL